MHCSGEHSWARVWDWAKTSIWGYKGLNKTLQKRGRVICLQDNVHYWQHSLPVLNVSEIKAGLLCLLRAGTKKTPNQPSIWKNTPNNNHTKGINLHNHLISSDYGHGGEKGSSLYHWFTNQWNKIPDEHQVLVSVCYYSFPQALQIGWGPPEPNPRLRISTFPFQNENIFTYSHLDWTQEVEVFIPHCQCNEPCKSIFSMAREEGGEKEGRNIVYQGKVRKKQ